MINADKKIIEFPESLDIPEKSINHLTQEFLNNANHLLYSKEGWINLVSDAEMSCLALSTELTKRKIDNIIAIDERTTRILAEKPENLEKIMSEKLHTKINLSGKNINA